MYVLPDNLRCRIHRFKIRVFRFGDLCGDADSYKIRLSDLCRTGCCFDVVARSFDGRGVYLPPTRMLLFILKDLLRSPSLYRCSIKISIKTHQNKPILINRSELVCIIKVEMVQRH